MKTIINVCAAVCALIVVGCASKMAALNSEKTSEIGNSLGGKYYLERVNAGDVCFDSSGIRKGILSDQILKKAFVGTIEDKQCLPVSISVSATKANANGGMASVNNLLALCTLTIWPCISAEESDYTVTVETVMGRHAAEFKILNRECFGLSPFAIIPVPGWADVRGEDAKISAYHLSQVVAGIREACVPLADDYQAFLKNQSNWLEKIDQIRSEEAFQLFKSAPQESARVSALARICNKTIAEKHQDEFIAAFKASESSDVKLGILKLLNDASISKLPYDPSLVGYWTRITDQRVLAKVYQNCFAQIAQDDRAKFAARFSDESILRELIAPPSKEQMTKANNERRDSIANLHRRLRELNAQAENLDEQALKTRVYSRGKEGEQKAATYKAQAVAARTSAGEIEKQIKRLEDTPVECGLYVADADARKVLYGKIAPSVLEKVAIDEVNMHEIDDWNRGRLNELETAVEIAKNVSSREIAGRIAIAIMSKVNKYRSLRQKSWLSSWSDEDKAKEDKLAKSVEGMVYDDLLEKTVRDDVSSLVPLAPLFKDKKRLSALGMARIENAVKGGNDGEINAAWKEYGGLVTDDEMLKVLSLASTCLRRPAFDRVRDEKVKAEILAAVKAALENELRLSTSKQGELAELIDAIGNGEELVAWIRCRNNQTDLQRREAFNKMKGRMIALSGEVRNVGATAFGGKTYVSLKIGKLDRFSDLNVQFNVKDACKEAVGKWEKGKWHAMRGRVKGTGDLEDDASCEDGEVVPVERFNEARGIKGEIDDIKRQLREMEENHVPPEPRSSSLIGKAASSWTDGGVNGLRDELESVGDELDRAARALDRQLEGVGAELDRSVRQLERAGDELDRSARELNRQLNSLSF